MGAVIAALLGLFGPSLAGCQWISMVGGRTLQVEMRSAPDVASGLAVYAAGVEIGVTGAPQVVAGKVVLPVHLFRQHRDAVPPQAVFVLGDNPDRAGENSLVVYDLGPDLAEKAGPAANGHYRGFASVWELALLVGREAAQELVGEVWKTIDEAGRELSESIRATPSAGK